VFLEEIGETSLQMRAKLLGVIQNREIQRVVSPEVRKVDVRLIAATNRDLRAEVLAVRFREDLFTGSAASSCACRDWPNIRETFRFWCSTS
jgi:transcriptional regulator with GAF, ATPase, and Fis domain